MATNFAVKITRWKAPEKQEDPYLSEPQSPAMKRVMLELSQQSTLAAEEAQRKVAAAVSAVEYAIRHPPPTPAEIEAADDRRRKEEHDRWLAQENALEAAKANPGPPVVWRLASEVEAEERARAEQAALEAAQAQVQVAEFDEIAEPPAPAPPAPPGPGTVMYSDPLV